MKKLLVVAAAVSFFLIWGQEVKAAESSEQKTYNPASVIVTDENQNSTEYQLEVEGQSRVYTARGYTDRIVYNFGGYGNDVRFWLTLNYSYSDGSYVRLDSVSVSYQVLNGVAFVFPDGDPVILQFSDSVSVMQIMYVGFTLDNKAYYYSMYANIDYWGNIQSDSSFTEREVI